MCDEIPLISLKIDSYVLSIFCDSGIKFKLCIKGIHLYESARNFLLSEWIVDMLFYKYLQMQKSPSALLKYIIQFILISIFNLRKGIAQCYESRNRT